jgi:hypothetical protein
MRKSPRFEGNPAAVAGEREPEWEQDEPLETGAEREAQAAEVAARTAEGNAGYYSYALRVAREEGREADTVQRMEQDAARSADATRSAREAADKACEAREAGRWDPEAGQ